MTVCKGIVASIKTGEVRRIPLYPELVRLGFLAYIELLVKQGADRLFPDFRVKSGDSFEASGEDFSQLLRACGLRDDKAPPGQAVLGTYVLRKTFLTMCRNQGVVSKEITGHSDGTTTAIQDRSYIFGPEPLRRNFEQLSKLQILVTVPPR